MTSRVCAVPSCSRLAPGSFNDFCALHHFQIPKIYTDMVRRTRIEAFNCTNDDNKKYLEEQLASYIRVAVGKLPQMAGQR